jgi:hypothetical protein
MLLLVFSPLLGTLLITKLRCRPLPLLTHLLLLSSLLLGLSDHLLGSRLLLLVMQHPKDLLLLLSRGRCDLQIKT